MYRRELIPIGGLLAIFVLVGWQLLTLHAQTPAREPAVVLGDLSTATMLQIRDAQGQTILQGQFGKDEEDDPNEREATLASTGVDADARGTAEIDLSDPGRPVEQELEIDIEKVAPNARFQAVIDGREVGGFGSDASGKAAVEWKSTDKTGASSR